MRILMLADVFFPDTIGGAGRVASHLSHQLCKRGHEVHVLTRNPEKTLPSHQEIEANLFAHRFDLAASEGISFFLSEIKNAYGKAKRSSHETDFDLVCAHQSLVALGPFLSSSIRSKPFVHCFYSPWHEEYLIKKRNMQGETPCSAKTVAFFMRKMEKRVLSKALKIFVLSRYSAGQISEIHHLPQQKVVMIPAGIELDRFTLPESGKNPVRKEMDIGPDKTVIFTVRNLVPRMGIENLIKAFSQSNILREKGLLLIGGEGFLKESLRGMVKDYGLERTVKLLGRVSEEDLSRYYQAADFFVLPTRELEGFGLVILESMACGTPVLGTPIGAIPETVGLFDKNLLFEGVRSEDLKTKLEDVINRPEKYRFDPQICRKFVEERYSWEKMADAFEREVMRLIKERSN
ncbi:MAG: glycosyltransferase family 4 protein [Deltaproteobacteria bacterium]|nr:glycosyltransferase family 4 protein [Deltaproteobacteria bacterium]